MKTILYATDYSENSVAALKYASFLSKAIHATLQVIHVFDYPTMLDDLSLKGEPAFPDIEGDALKKHHSKLIDFCKKHLGTDIEKIDVKVEAIENRSVVTGIVFKADIVKPLLIIMGIKGGSALREVIMGNTTKRLIEKAPCPVLSVPQNVNFTQIKTIVYATDFEEEDLGAINKLAEIAAPFNAKIKIVHVSELKESLGIEEKKDIEAKIYKYIKYPNLELDIIYSDAVFDDLITYLNNSNADLIAMLERDTKNLAATIFHRDLVKRMESYGKVPLMSFNAKNYGIFHL